MIENPATVAALDALVDSQVERMETMTIHQVTAAALAGELPWAAYYGYRHTWALARNPEQLSEIERSWYAYPDDDAARVYAAKLSRRCGARAFGA